MYQTGQQRGFVKKEVHPYVLFFSMVHAVDMYVHMGHCGTEVEKHILILPEDLEKYVELLKLIFIEGVLV